MIKRLIDILLFSSIFISLGSAALVIRTYFILEIDINWAIVLFVCFSTLFTYNISKIIPLWKFWNLDINEVYAYNKRNKWNLKHLKQLFYLSIISLVLILFFSFDFHFNQLVFLTHLGVISVIYSTPIFSGKALRTFPLLKIFLIAYVWGAMSILPIYNGFSSLDENVIFIFLDSFFFIVAITIPFDIRDYARDKSLGVKTIPSILGIEKAKYLSIVLLLISSIFSYYVIQNTIQEIINLVLTILFIPVLYFSKEENGEYFYLGLVDALLIIRLIAFI